LYNVRAKQKPENELEVVVVGDRLFITLLMKQDKKNHYHPKNKDGEKYPDGSHYEYGKPKQVNEEEKKQQKSKEIKEE
jgi:hypothetical protein